ncbi:thiosulfate oxidation carrier protein SoxY [Rhodocyclus tenuis]|uniref:thiosulfate oxidation carrier protein SoxY n=1 Tax=Rhodocyclus tenuis TaxID=1066 RepID=UPI001907FA44|nr:thiosulfate oxidation carrier protein SoxY [Rhodocyclus tenuis]MBK1681688.1 hypothetical protein [Rhodocyclus tenuis]
MSFAVSRREFLVVAGAAALAGGFVGVPGIGNARAATGTRNAGAFKARSWEAAYSSLGLPTPQPSSAILINAPDVADNGASVPVDVSIRVPNARRLLLIGERNSFPLLADIEFSRRAEPWFEARIKLAETSDVRAIVIADGKAYTASRRVRVIVGGCVG